MNDRRRCYRLKAELPVAFKASKFQRHISVGLTQNISATGLCFLTTEAIETGRDLTLEIQIPPAEKLILDTTVIWVRESGYISRDYFVGVKIKEPMNENAGRYVKFFAKQLSSANRKIVE